MNWVTIARPIAARRALYRRKKEASTTATERFELFLMAEEAVDWVWNDIKEHLDAHS